MYIGNTNTKRLHSPNCRAVKMIAPKHVQYTEDGEGFHVLCKWCKNQGYRKGGRQVEFDEYEILDMDGVQFCHDTRFKEILNKTGCLAHIGCGDKHHGSILMYPHPGGVEVQDEEGKWWIFFQCGECGYQTSLTKAIHHLHLQKEREKATI